MSESNWLARALNLLNRPHGLSGKQFTDALKGIGKKEGISEEEVATLIEKYFSKYEDFFYVNSRNSGDILELILAWVASNYSSDNLWALAEAKSQHPKEEWYDIKGVLSAEVKKAIIEDISQEILQIDKENIDRTDSLINKRRLGLDASHSAPTSNWKDELPVRFYYEYAIRDGTFIYDGIRRPIARLIRLAIALDEEAAVGLYEKLGHPLIRLYVSHELIEFRRRACADKFIRIIQDYSDPLIVSAAILQGLLSVGELERELESRKKEDTLRFQKSLENDSIDDLKTKLANLRKDIEDGLSSINSNVAIRLCGELLANCEFVYPARMGERSKESIGLEEFLVKRVALLLERHRGIISPDEFLVHLKAGTRTCKSRFLWEVAKILAESDNQRQSFAICLLAEYSARIKNVKGHDFHSFAHDRDWALYLEAVAEAIVYLSSRAIVEPKKFFSDHLDNLAISVWDLEENYSAFLESVRHFFHLLLAMTISCRMNLRDRKNVLFVLKDTFLGLWEHYGDHRHIDDTYPDLIILHLFLALNDDNPRESISFLEEVLLKEFIPGMTLRKLVADKLLPDNLMAEARRKLKIRCDQIISFKNNQFFQWWYETWREVGEAEYSFKVAQMMYESRDFDRRTAARQYLAAMLDILHSKNFDTQELRKDAIQVFQDAFPFYATDSAALSEKKNLRDQFMKVGILV
ncbi:MAG: hypothetical protein AB7F43_01785 [Bacteriovoracia bacterium]